MWLCFRDMDEAGSILKGCQELVAQATSTIPRSMSIARGGGAATESGGVADGGELGKTTSDKKESMDVQSGSGGSEVRI